MKRWLVVSSLLWGVACGGHCPEAATVPKACSANSVPVGRWSGEWQSFPLAHPDFTRSGNLDLTVAADGKMTGQTSEHDNPDTGSMTGSVDARGHFQAEAVVVRSGAEKRYTLKGAFVCERNGPAGSAEVLWGDGERGNLKFRLATAP